MDEKEYWFWLLNIKGIGYIKTKKLLDYYKNPMEIYCADRKELLVMDYLKITDVNNITESRNMDNIKKTYETMVLNGVDMVLRNEENYPKKLNNIYDPPFGIYYRGSLPKDEKPTISIVGARNCSHYGKEVSKYFAQKLANAGIQVVSGMARGIDAWAHKGALLAKGTTFGVLGCGVDICYPKENIEIFMDMQENGGILSEFPLKTMPRAGNFPVRNRIISGISDGVLVIEAEKKSGSLITVDMALEQGKNVYAIPGRIDDSLSMGCNNLIRSGAKIVTDVCDILEDFMGVQVHENKGEMYPVQGHKSKKNKIVLETETKIVYACLRLEPKHIEEIVSESGLKFSDVLDKLFQLEDLGLIIQTTNSYYAKVNDIW